MIIHFNETKTPQLFNINIFSLTGVVLDDCDFLPMNTLALTEFDQKQSLGSGGIDLGNSSNSDSQDEIGIRCWNPSPVSLLKLLSLCPKLKTIRLLTEERELSVFAEALSEMDEDFDIEEIEVYSFGSSCV